MVAGLAIGSMYVLSGLRMREGMSYGYEGAAGEYFFLGLKGFIRVLGRWIEARWGCVEDWEMDTRARMATILGCFGRSGLESCPSSTTAVFRRTEANAPEPQTLNACRNTLGKTRHTHILPTNPLRQFTAFRDQCNALTKYHDTYTDLPHFPLPGTSGLLLGAMLPYVLLLLSIASQLTAPH